MQLTTKLAQALIGLTRGTAFDGTGCGFGLDDAQLRATDPKQRFRQAWLEREDAPRFLAMFTNLRLDGLDVLDFGCGYGGKAVEFAATANRVVGVEPVPHHIKLATQYAASLGVENAEFRLCPEHSIPSEDDAFDAVLSHDVIEHVDNPQISLREIYRVLKPGGRVYLVFPPYWGAMSHHLDYVTRFPGIHWLFAPDTLVSAINSMGRADIPEQPRPRPGWTGKKKVLPMLNGLSGNEFRRIASKWFDVEQVRPVLIGSGGSSRLAKIAHAGFSRPLSRLGGLPRDMVTSSIIAILRKRPA